MILSQVKFASTLLEYGNSSIMTDYTNVWFTGSLEEIARGFICKKYEIDCDEYYNEFDVVSTIVEKTCGLPKWWEDLSSFYQRIYDMRAFL